MHKKPLAIILAAGKGMRLNPLTQKIPKPLVEVNHQPIIFNTLGFLEKIGLKHCVVVVGYKADLLKNRINRAFAERLNIKYIVNEYFAETNNAFSLWLARKYLNNYNILLMEADIMFDWGIAEYIKFSYGHSLWLADKFTALMNGALLVADKKDNITQIKIVKSIKKTRDNYYKSIGILVLCQNTAAKLAVWLKEELNAGNKNLYYDLVLAKHIREANISVKYIDKLKWWEIDNTEDLEYARQLFHER